MRTLTTAGVLAPPARVASLERRGGRRPGATTDTPRWCRMAQRRRPCRAHVVPNAHSGRDPQEVIVPSSPAATTAATTITVVVGSLDATPRED